MNQRAFEQRVVDVKGASSHLGLSEPHLNRLRSIGGGPQFAKLGRRVVYRISDLDAWLERHIRTSTSDELGHMHR